MSPEELETIRKNVQQGIKEIEEGHGKHYEGEEGLKRSQQLLHKLFSK